MCEVRRTEPKPNLSILELECPQCGAVSWREQDERGWNRRIGWVRSGLPAELVAANAPDSDDVLPFD